MDDHEWRPLFQRQEGKQTEYDVLQEGLPEYLLGSLWRWLMDRAAEGSWTLILRLERRLRIVLAHEGDRPLGGTHTAPNKILARYWEAADDNSRLVLLDAILRDMQIRGAEAFKADKTDQNGHVRVIVEGAKSLGTILTDGGSVWDVHIEPPAWGLVRRVNETTAALVAAATAPDIDAAREIRAAWSACYRHDPDPDEAYRHAVLAVEAVTIPVTVPKSPRATLGQVAGHIRDTAADWTVGGLDAPEIGSGTTLLAMVQTLWHNQERHALQDGSIANVSQSEAEAGVALAVTLVHWFTTGLAHRRSAAE